jgi:hypothetical protein
LPAQVKEPVSFREVDRRHALLQASLQSGFLYATDPMKLVA